MLWDPTGLGTLAEARGNDYLCSRVEQFQHLRDEAGIVGIISVHEEDRIARLNPFE